MGMSKITFINETNPLGPPTDPADPKVNAANLNSIQDNAEAWANAVGLRSGQRVFDVQNYSSHADGTTPDHVAINGAITDANAAGGGLVLCSTTPTGTGYGVEIANPIIMKSNVILQCQGWGGRLKRVGAYVHNGTTQRFIKTGTAATSNAQLLGVQIDGDAASVTLTTTTLTGSHTLPVGTITVASTTGFPASGSIIIGNNVVTYTATTPTTFTGCLGGTGTFSGGTTVKESSTSYTATAIRYELPTSGQHTGVRIEGCRIIDWPGPAIHVVSADSPIIRGNDINARRGGIVVWFDTPYPLIANNRVKAADDCIAAQAQSGTDGNTSGNAVRRGAIVGNILEEQGSDTADVDTSNNGISLKGLQDSVIASNTIIGGGGAATSNKAGINVDRSAGTVTFASTKLLIANNRILDPLYFGIQVRSGAGTSKITVRDNQITGSGADGIRLWATASGSVMADLVVEGNDVIDCGADGGANDLAGIALYGTAGATWAGISVSHNNVLRPKAQGIVVQSTVAATGVTFDNNRVIDPNQGSNANTDGILIQGCDRFTVSGNRVLKTSGSALARYGINVSGTNGQGSDNFALSGDFITAATNGLATLLDTTKAYVDAAIVTADDRMDTGDANTLTAAEAYADGPFIVTTRGSNYTLAASDVSNVTEANSSSAITITIPAATFAVGQVSVVKRIGSGTVGFAAGGGMTMHTPFGTSISAQYGSAEIYFRSASECIVSCD